MEQKKLTTEIAEKYSQTCMEFFTAKMRREELTKDDKAYNDKGNHSLWYNETYAEITQTMNTLKSTKISIEDIYPVRQEKLSSEACEAYKKEFTAFCRMRGEHNPRRLTLMVYLDYNYIENNERNRAIHNSIDDIWLA